MVTLSRLIPHAHIVDLAIAGGHLHQTERQLRRIGSLIRRRVISTNGKWPAIKERTEEPHTAQRMHIAHLMDTAPIPTTRIVAQVRTNQLNRLSSAA